MKLFSLFVCFFICQKCLIEAHGHHHDHDHHHDEGFEWTEEKSEYAEIQLEVAGPGVIQKFTHASGKIIAHPDHLAYVIPKVEGSVSSIQKNVGDLVVKGDVLAIIESKQIAEAKAHYLLAKSRANIQKELLQTEIALLGISPQQDYWQAQLAYEEAAIELEHAMQDLYTLGFSDRDIGQIESEPASHRRFYALKAPLNGKILARNLTLGEMTNEATQAFIVGNFEKVWVEMHVAQEDVQYLKEGLEVEIGCVGGRCAHVEVCQFNPVICEETRMATATAVMKNPSNEWTPGQYVNASILTKKIELPVVVPKEAVQKMKGENYVFIQCEDSFEPCKVKLGKMDERSVEIVSGLKAGDCYVSNNAFCLKADYEKEEVEHTH